MPVNTTGFRFRRAPAQKIAFFHGLGRSLLSGGSALQVFNRNAGGDTAPLAYSGALRREGHLTCFRFFELLIPGKRLASIAKIRARLRTKQTKYLIVPSRRLVDTLAIRAVKSRVS